MCSPITSSNGQRADKLLCQMLVARTFRTSALAAAPGEPAHDLLADVGALLADTQDLLGRLGGSGGGPGGGGEDEGDFFGGDSGGGLGGGGLGGGGSGFALDEGYIAAGLPAGSPDRRRGAAASPRYTLLAGLSSGVAAWRCWTVCCTSLHRTGFEVVGAHRNRLPVSRTRNLQHKG